MLIVTFVSGRLSGEEDERPFKAAIGLPSLGRIGLASCCTIDGEAQSVFRHGRRVGEANKESGTGGAEKLTDRGVETGVENGDRDTPRKSDGPRLLGVFGTSGVIGSSPTLGNSKDVILVCPSSQVNNPNSSPAESELLNNVNFLKPNAVCRCRSGRENEGNSRVWRADIRDRARVNLSSSASIEGDRVPCKFHGHAQHRNILTNPHNSNRLGSPKTSSSFSAVCIDC